eukprot:2062902-Amphidinium_carterae.1
MSITLAGNKLCKQLYRCTYNVVVLAQSVKTKSEKRAVVKKIPYVLFPSLAIAVTRAKLVSGCVWHAADQNRLQ